MLLPRASDLAGALRPWPAVLVVWGPGSASERHAHHCWHLVLGLDAPLAVTLSPHRARRAPAVLTAPDVPHAIDARGGRALVAHASLAAIAARARLSPGRFMHAFTATAGIPLRPYVRWTRLQRAAGAIAAGRGSARPRTRPGSRTRPT